MAGPWERYATPSGKITDPALLAQLNGENPFIKYAQPGANPYVAYSIPGTGPKPPSGYAKPGAAAIAAWQGGPEDPDQVGRLASARANAEAAAQGAKEAQIARLRSGLDVTSSRQKLLDERTIKAAPIPKTPDQLHAAQQDLLNVIDQAQLARGQAGFPNTGFVGDIASHIPGTSAYDLASTLSTIGANTAFDRLQRMRQDSPTGAAVGGASDADMRLLKDSVAGLSQGQGAERFTGNLDTVINRYKDMYQRIGGDMSAFDPTGRVVVQPYSGERRDGNAPIIGAGQSSPPTHGGRGGGISPGGPAAFGPSTPGGTDQLTFAQNGSRSESDPTLAGVNAKVSDMLRGGASAEGVRTYLRSIGVDPTTVSNIDAAVKFRTDHPAYRGNYSVSIDQRQIPMSDARATMNRLGQSGFGAYALGAGDAVTLGTLDNISGNPALTRAAMGQISGQHPWATIAGNVTGGAALGGGAEAALGRLGLPAAARVGGIAFAPRALATDAAIGAGYGAGSADDGNRLAGAILGGATGMAAGGVGRNLVAGGLASLASPTGGEVRPLYDAGVRPTIGQRFAGSGMVGDTINTVEQALQSIPVLGGAVRNARGAARDQFERGAFDTALAELGDSLPSNVRLGTEAHAYLQNATNHAYDRARSGMQLVPDGQMLLGQPAKKSEADDDRDPRLSSC